MEGLSMTQVAISVLFITSLALPQASALSAAETCKIVKNETYIADPNDCQGWALCRNGIPLFGKCDPGLLYDSSSGTCDSASSVSCNINPATMCNGLDGIYKADPYNCQKFCICENGVAKWFSCPDGQYFDQSQVQCIYKEKSNCVPNSPCLLAQNCFVKDISTCTGWFRCANGQVINKGNCPTGYYYNPLKELCDYPKNVPCALGPPPKTTPTATPGTCTAAPTGVTGSFFMAQPKSCNGYFYCKQAGPIVVGQWGQCPVNSCFDQTKQQCGDPYTVACTANRCDGTTKQFMTVAGTNCKGYYVCANNEITSQSTCPVDHPYFDEVRQECVVNQPDYLICTAAVTAQ